jgi:putative hemolysin
MKRTILIGLMAALSAGAWAEDKAMNLRKTAEGIRAGTVNVGKAHTLAEEGRFHQIHTETLGIKCGGCHTNDAYPDNYLYLRKSELPRVVDGEKVKAVERAKCIGCHSEGNVATVFYNRK